MSTLKQTDRLFSFDSPLGPDKLLVKSFQCKEGMSQLFHAKMELVSDDPQIDFSQILGRNVTVGIRLADQKTFRYFNGHISKFSMAPARSRLAHYEAEMVPWLWFLTLQQDCYVYQKKTVPQVIEDTFRQRLGFGDFQIPVQGSHGAWEYCCQYRENAVRFVTRLMEVEGMYYYFRHERGKHTLIITDHKTNHRPCENQSDFRFEHAFGPGYKRAVDTVFTWRPEKAVRPAKYTHKEFNHEKPDDPLLAELDVKAGKPQQSTLELYDYPGEYEERKDADDWVRLRVEELEAEHETASGTGCCRTMTPGFRFNMAEHHRQDQNREYLITSVTHTAQEGTFVAGTDAEEAKYENSFTCMPASVQFRPQRSTEKPLMLGSQTAWVVGPKGEEIHVDNLGRVKVQFHWDRKGQRDEKSSCFIRVMQPWAGPNYGHIWIPRIGQEVIVDFLEGDPDRPLITGCVYNAKNLPPYPLPAKQTCSGVKTRSTKGGGQDNANELKFDDKKGSELFLMHAEKDMEITVEHDTTETIDHDRTLIVKNDQTEQVKGNKHGTVGGERREVIQGNLSEQVGAKHHEQVGGNIAIEAGGEIHLKAGARIVLEAGAGITFIGAGASFIDVNAAGIVIQGPMTLINCASPMALGGLGSLPSIAGLPGGLPGIPSVAGLGGALGGGLAGGLGGLAGAAGLGGALGGGLTGALGGLSGAAGQLSGALGNLGSMASQALGGAMGQLQGMASQALGGVTGALGSLGQQLSSAVGGAGGLMQQLNGMAGSVGSLVPQMGGGMQDVLGSVMNQVSGALGGAGSAAGQMMNALGGAQSAVQQMSSPLQNLAGMAGQLTGGALGDAMPALQQALGGAGGGAQALMQNFAGAAEGASAMAQQLTGAASALGGQAISEALGQAGPLAAQLPGALGGAGAAAQQLANAFSQAAPAAEGLSGAFAALGQAASQLPDRPPAELTGAVQQAFGNAQSGAQALAQHMAVGAGNAAALTQQLNTANAALSALSSPAGGAAAGPGTRFP